MTGRRYHRRHNNRRLYRDRENGWIMGVCAGISEYFDWNLMAVRLIVIVLLVFNTFATVLVYFVAAWLLRDKPLHYRGSEEESHFWRRDRV